MADNIEKKDAEEIKSLRQAEAEITRELVALRERLSVLSENDVVNLQETADIQNRILSLEKEKRGITTELVDLSGNVLQTDQKRAELEGKRVERQKKSNDFLAQASILQGKLAESLKIQKQYQAEFESRTEELQEMRKGELKDSQYLLKAQNIFTSSAQKLSSLRKDDEQSYSRINDIAKRMNANALDYLDDVLEISDAEKAARDGKYIELSIGKEIRAMKQSQIDLSETEEELQYQRLKLMDATTAAEKEAAQAEINFLEIKKGFLQDEQANLSGIIAEKKELNKINEESANQTAELNEKMASIKETINKTSIGKAFDGVESKISKIPGGSALTKAFGFDKMKENIMTNLGDSFKNVMTGFQQGGAAGFKSLTMGVKSFGKALMAGPQIIIFAIIAAVATLIEMFNGADQAISDIQKDLGGTKAQAVETYKAAQGMAAEMGIVGVNTKEIAKGMATVSEIMGGLDVATQIKAGNKELEQFAKDATVLSQKFGLSAEEIGNIKSLATITGESMGSLVQKSTGLAKGLMTDKEAMKTLASVPKSVAVAFKGGSEALVKAAQKAKLLGMDLKKVQEIGDGMLDLESSLEKEMEARVITGKQLNLDTARQYALQGNIAGLQDELLNQAGSLEEFTNMNRLQQKSMADAMGMSVDEMTEMLTKAQELRDVGLDSSKVEELQKKNAKELADIAANTSNAEQKAYIEKMAREKESATMSENLADIMTKIQEKITAFIAPLVEVVHSMFDAGDAAGGIMDGLTPVFDILGGIGKIVWTMLVHPFKMVFAVLGPIFDAIKSVFSEISSGEESTGGIMAAFDKINGVLTTVFSVIQEIAGVIVTALLDPLKILWKSIVTPLWEAFSGISDALSKAFAPLSGATETGQETAGIMDTIKKVFESLSPVIALIGEIFAKTIIHPIKMFAEIVSFVVKLFTGDFQGAVSDLGNILMDQFLELPKIIIEALAGVIDAIFGTNLTEGVGKFFDYVKGIFDDIAEYVLNVGKLVLDYLMSPFDLVSTVIDGIVQMFSGDFMGGLETIGGGIKDFIMAPFDLVSGLFDNLMGTIGKITDKVSGALSIFGIGGDEAEEASEKAVEAKAAGSAEVKPAQGAAAAPAQAAAQQTKQSSQAGMATGAVKGMKPPSAMTEKELKEMGKTAEEYEKEWMKPIGAAATGGVIKKAGATLVGEKGPEVVSLPQGSVVANATATQQVGAAMGAMGGGEMEQSDSPELSVLQSIDSKMSALLEPLQKMGEMLAGVSQFLSGGVGSIAGSVMGSIGDTIGGLFGSSEQETAQPMQQSTMSASSMSAGGGESGAGAGGGGNVNLSSLESKLDTIANILNSAANQPTIIKVGEKVIEEIRNNLRVKATYMTATDNTYGRA